MAIYLGNKKISGIELVNNINSSTYVGTIIAFMGKTAPVNYLACDGAEYNIADYSELSTFIKEQFGSVNYFGGDGTTTFAVPDLRGEFIRGTGTNSHTNQGSGADVGVHQDSTSSNGSKFIKIDAAKTEWF